MSYTNSTGMIFYLHSRQAKNGATLYYFSRDPANAVPLPKGFQVVEAQKSKLPLLKRA